ncbi:hypothetical protein BD770DRAFT_416843 [Pilaira anomala]|nr:hypothetical protein BD770DRAFT_416843 [Pilaira anomala]
MSHQAPPAAVLANQDNICAFNPVMQLFFSIKPVNRLVNFYKYYERKTDEVEKVVIEGLQYETNNKSQTEFIKMVRDLFKQLRESKNPVDSNKDLVKILLADSGKFGDQTEINQYYQQMIFKLRLFVNPTSPNSSGVEQKDMIRDLFGIHLKVTIAPSF